MLILPGGCYEYHADYEGAGYAAFFNSLGFVSFVLNYRLGSAGYRHPAMLQDAARAVRWIRANARKYGVRKICVIGSSAGGHLAATLLTQWDRGNSKSHDMAERQSSRPDAGILCYPVIDMGKYTHAGSRDNLLGLKPKAVALKAASAHLHVTAQTPPCFLWHTVEDELVPVENSLLFATALRRAGAPFELHLYEKGAHGLALKNGHPWSADCIAWLKLRFL